MIMNNKFSKRVCPTRVGVNRGLCVFPSNLFGLSHASGNESVNVDDLLNRDLFIPHAWE